MSKIILVELLQCQRLLLQNVPNVSIIIDIPNMSPACVKSKVVVGEVWEGERLAAPLPLLQAQPVRRGQPGRPVVEPDNLEMWYYISSLSSVI